jgi:hypothetical protein
MADSNMNEKFPEQFDEYKLILEEIYNMHVKKSQDYSSWNVRGVGETGVAVRIWDKTARLMNLLGWDISTGKLQIAKNPHNESLDDTLYDLAAYAVIMLVFRRGKWGK